MDKLIEIIKRHEGYSDKVYKDTENNLTCGWGHFLKEGTKINEVIAEEFFKMDIASAISDFNKLNVNIRKNLNNPRRRVIIDMIFNMGLFKVTQFKKMFEAIENQDWKGAANNIMDSKYAFQVGDGPGGKFDRAEELAKIMEIGED